MTVGATVHGDGLLSDQKRALEALKAHQIPAKLLAHDPTLWGRTPRARP